LAESEHAVMLKGALQSSSPGDDVVLVFGPEGGWTATELDLFRGAGWVFASLGTTVLRAETAAIAATAIVLSELQ